MIRPVRLVGLLTVIAVLAASQVVLACPVCFRVEDHATVSGVYSAVFVLLGVTTAVLAGVGTFIAGFIRRARRFERAETDGGL